MAAITSTRETMDFTNPNCNASPSKSVTPVSIQYQLPFSTAQPGPVDQDRRELERKNCTDSELEAFLIEKSDLACNEAISLLMNFVSDENLANDCHGSFDLLTNIRQCIKHFTYPTETVATFPDLQCLEESTICRLVSSLQEKRPNLSKANATRVLLANETHVCEVTGTEPIPDEKELVSVIRSIMPNPAVSYKGSPATEKEEKMAKPVQLHKTENQNPGMNSSAEEEAELKPHEEWEIKSDAEIDIKSLHDLMHQICDLQINVKERREWAQEKALQAARKVGYNFIELITLRTIRERKERMKKDNKEKEDEIAKMMADCEEEVKRTEGNAERALMEVRRLEKENKEMWAEIEAARIERSETNKKCKRLEKGLKRNNKSAEISKKQMSVLQAEVEEVKKDNVKIEERIEMVRMEISESKVRTYNITLIDL